MDITKLSDAELRAAYERGGSAPTDLTKLSDAELRGLAAGQDLSLDNAVRSVAQGIPVIGGAMDAVAAGGDAVAGPIVDALAQRFGFGNNASGTSTADTIGQRYRENLAREKAHSRTYAERHPIANTAGELAGGVAGAAAVLPVAPLLSGTTITSSAALGGADALTRSGGDVSQALTGAAVGAAVPAALGGAARAFPWLWSLASGVSPQAQALARQAGREGGEAGEMFLRHMAAPEREALVDMLDAGVDRLTAVGQAQYRANMARVGMDTTRLSYRPIVQTLQDASDSLIHRPSGFVKDPQAMNVVRQMAGLVHDHAARPGQTADVLSFDALKQAMGAIMQRQPFGSNERRVAGNIYHAVRNTIERQAPEYGIVMRRYSAMKDQVAEARAALGNSNRASADTIIGKLLSTMRNDVSSRYGARADALAGLDQHAPMLKYAIAGQTQNAALPRGIVARGLGAINLQNGMVGDIGNVARVGLIGLGQSPRVVGNINYGVGVAQRFMPSPLPGLNAAQNALLSGTYDPAEHGPLSNR